MKLILLVILSPLISIAEEASVYDEQGEKCSSALATAKSEVQAEYTRLSNRLAQAEPHAIDAASGKPIMTGDPVTDLVTAAGSTIQESADRATQISQARGQVDDDCFQQLVQIQDKCHDIRQKDFERRREVGNAETEKLRQESEIRSKCWGEASQLFQAEMGRLAAYAQRIVGSVGGATKSQKDIQSLRNNFYNNCMNSGPTQEALKMCKVDLDNKMRNFGIVGEELAADLNYHESTKTAQLKEHCKLRQQRIDEQEAVQKNSLMQKLGLQLMALNYASQSSKANASEKEQVIGTYESLEGLLNLERWDALKKSCANLITQTGDTSEVLAVPKDVWPAFEEVNKACKPPGGTRTCVTSSGRDSKERQQERALSSQ